MNRKQISGFVAALLCLALLFGHIPSVRAEDCFTINVDTLDMDSLNSDEYVALNLSAQTQGIRVQKYISDSSELAVPVRLTLTQMDSGTLLFDKDYGYQSGTFDSGVIYLPYVDNRTIPYLVTLYVADYVFAMPFMHLQPRLMYNGACTYGVRLRDLDSSLSADWLMGTMVDLTALRSEGYRVVDVCASNYSIIGQATIQMQGDSLCVQLSFVPSANVEVNYLSLYVITDCAGMTTADVSRMPQPARSAGEWIDVSGATSALIYMPMQVSYDSAGLSTFGYDLSSGDLQAQIALWQANRSGGAVYVEPTPMPETDDGSQWSGGGIEDGGTGWDGSSAGDGSTGWDDNVGWDDGSGWSDNTGWIDDSGNSTGWDGGAGWVDHSGWNEGSAWDDGTAWDDGSGWVDATPTPAF